ncbi:hypothetical protein [Poseidonocella pacifica]|nr:hypothetical protein [Poseidonocella pacifica]
MTIVLGVLPGLLQAQGSYWSYGDWQVMVEAVDTGEDYRVTCQAWTGGDGMPVVKLQVSNGDALPPYYYPAPMMEEYAPRGHATVMQNGQRVLFQFDTNWYTEGYASGGYNYEGLAWATVQPHHGDARAMLSTMRDASTLWITADGVVLYQASLAGFTAAYGKIAEQCGFSTVGVID